MTEPVLSAQIIKPRSGPREVRISHGPRWDDPLTPYVTFHEPEFPEPGQRLRDYARLVLPSDTPHAYGAVLRFHQPEAVDALIKQLTKIRDGLAALTPGDFYDVDQESLHGACADEAAAMGTEPPAAFGDALASVPLAGES